MVKRYSVPCRACDCDGSYNWTNSEGDIVVDRCRWCYRRTITKLFEELKASLNA